MSTTKKNRDWFIDRLEATRVELRIIENKFSDIMDELVEIQKEKVDDFIKKNREAMESLKNWEKEEYMEKATEEHDSSINKIFKTKIIDWYKNIHQEIQNALLKLYNEDINSTSTYEFNIDQDIFINKDLKQERDK